MRVYGMTYRETMALPMKVFWQLQASVSRVLSEENRDLLDLLTASQNSEAATQLRAHLDALAPAPVVMTGIALKEQSSVRDADAGSRLARLAG